MNECPDSALLVLRGIDCSGLKSRKLNAEHSLLLSMTLDKNYIDLTSDSLINIAVDYYRHRKDYERRFLSLYYQGRVYQNAKQYSKAMLSFTEAEQIIDKVDDDFAKGHLYAHLGSLYDTFYNFPRSLESYIDAEHFYANANRINHVNYAKLSIGCAYVNMNRMEDAEQILEEVIEWGRRNNMLFIVPVKNY